MTFTVQDCVDIVRGLMKRKAKEMEGLTEENICQMEVVHAEYMILAEAYELMDAIRNASRERKKAPNSTILC